TETNSGQLNAVFRRFLLNYIIHNESLKCERLKSQKIRRRPESCHGFHPEFNRFSCIIVESLGLHLFSFLFFSYFFFRKMQENVAVSQVLVLNLLLFFFLCY
ncbi:UNVERIFIED_CONTAM: hypothetical protein H355_001381, partial [Colinus virginianus]